MCRLYDVLVVGNRGSVRLLCKAISIKEWLSKEIVVAFKVDGYIEQVVIIPNKEDREQVRKRLREALTGKDMIIFDFSDLAESEVRIKGETPLLRGIFEF